MTENKRNPLCLFSFLIPFTLVGDQHLISPFNITPQSHIKVTRKEEMITD